MENIRELKERLTHLETLFKLNGEICEAREALSREMELLKQEIRNEQKRGIDPTSKQELLEACRTQYRKLDHEIDEMEEITPEILQSMRDDLIEKILVLHPHQKSPYSELSQRHSDLTGLSTLVDTCVRNLGEIEVALGESYNALRKVRRFWVLGYIFGANPNAVIGNCLKTSGAKATEIIASLKEWKEVREIPEEAVLYLEELLSVVQELERECKRTWNFRKVRTQFQELQERLSALKTTGEYLHRSLEVRQEVEEKALDQWIEEHS